ncbi:methyltransferase-like protein 17, mitochondrial [Scaptodrosophila lebanonensis]|uniref:Methyltransferase-like protein 17, mitochondrial n=1 Tax=Drosophila lebanonensis TaxID=7225 RepID=A0A6J2TK20_DROLE|nr:methyltransferase-like protein 17, mitochondrial [Scaptodrosophila lebanonensis]XP_030377006.1 methyltransferase-like protein 17, mitochondrial [Scaptodrosophila lebanonensis]
MCQRFTSKISVQVEPTVLTDLEQAELKPRKHPGIIKPTHVELPTQLSNALKCIVGDHPVKKLLHDSQLLNRYINSRHPPPTPGEIENKRRLIVEEVNAKMSLERLATLSEEEAARWQRKRELEINKRLGQRTYAWKPINYGPYEAIVYAVARGPQEYAVLMRILSELALRNGEFKPRSFLDFGSGVGTGTWAASSIWRDSIYEYYNVDSSRHMNELSELILCDGQENKQISVKNVFYRQFLPAIDTKYDLVLISHTLFELPSLEQRRETLLNLWRKCDGYMIIVEEGTRRGSELVNEARRFLLRSEQQEAAGHTLAPCPHDLRCPRLSNQDDRTPCNFPISFVPLRLASNSTADRQTALYSYVILKKGELTDATQPWPRIVRPTLVRSKHSICRLCTQGGNLQEVIFTAAKHGRPAYTCARVSRWGDRLPMALGSPQAKTKPTRAGTSGSEPNSEASKI